MQPSRTLSQWLKKVASRERYLFSIPDLKAVFPQISSSTFKTLLSRMVKAEKLIRVCRGLYAYAEFARTGLILFHAAAYLRPNCLNYISLETALSDLGIISQVPTHSITIASSGRSSHICCGIFGAIEFIHTSRKASDLAPHLLYDRRCRLWRAMPALAIRDMKLMKRNLDLIDWSEVDESI